jgi:hypothetical protein
MFTWICPQCGGEVLPSQEECPRCKKLSEPAPVAAPPAQPAAAPVPSAAPVPMQVAAPVAATPAYDAPHPGHKSTAVRDLLVMLGVAAVLLGVGYFVWNRGEQKEAKLAETKAEMEGVKARGAHPLAKQIEVTGIRLRIPKPGQAEVQLLVVNHSAAEIAELSMDVVLAGKNKGKEVAVFPVKVKRLGPFASMETTAKTKIEVSAIDLPDWQFLEAQVAIHTDEP